MSSSVTEAIQNLPPLRETIKAFGLNANKSLGQHFLLDLNLTAKIVRAANITPQDTVIEVGPGPGGLTRPLLFANPKKLIAIETDPRCIEANQPLVDIAPEQFELVHADAVKCDETDYAAPPFKVVANLPYNVGTAILLKWLKHIEHFTSFTLMFQKEVADRITAKPNTKAYGRLAIIVQYCCDVQRNFDLPAAAFTPPPKVDSTVVTLIPKKDIDKETFTLLGKVTHAAFNQRRKMLKSSLKPLFDNPEEALNAIGIDPTLRPENLEVAQFLKICCAVKPE